MKSVRSKAWLAVLAVATTVLPVPAAGQETVESPPPVSDDTLGARANRMGFLVGSTIGYTRWSDVEEPYRATLATEFNYVTVFPTMSGIEGFARGRFNFEVLDEEVAFAQEHGLKVKGHPLIWDRLGSHDDTPAWLNFSQPGCGGWSPDDLDQIMKEWIQATVAHFKGRVAVWDVVNEPFKRDDRTLSPGPYAPADLSAHCWNHHGGRLHRPGLHLRSRG